MLAHAMVLKGSPDPQQTVFADENTEEEVRWSGRGRELW